VIVADLTFELEYDGPALEAHEMDVRELAPALISTADLFQELNHQLYPVAPPLAVTVRATAEGSFLVQLKLIYDSMISTLAGEEATAAANLTAMVTVVGGLVALIRHRLRSEPVSQEAKLDEPGLVRVVFADGTILEIPQQVLEVRNNISIQRSLAEVVRPVGRPGIDIVRIRRDEVTIAEVPKADAGAFDAPSGVPERDVLHSGERETYLTIHTAGFHTNRWRLWDGQSLYWTAIRDENFIDLLNSGLRVGKLDVLHCLVSETQWRDAIGFHLEVEVLRVLDVLPYDPGEQTSLDLQ
jgi:hypothetical protein